MRKYAISLVGALVAALLFAIPLFAASTGDLSGTVVDPSGAVVANARVTVKNLTNGSVRTVTTNDFGQFSVPQLELGSYQVMIDKAGFKAYTENANIRSGENTRLSAQMQLGASSETVEVSGAIPLLDVATAQVSDSLDTQQIQALPNQARDPVAYATLSPGTVPVSKDNPFLGTGSYNSNGSRGRANNIVVDNIISSDISTTGEGGLGTFSYDGVQEFKLITNNFDAEFGRNSGSQLQIVTKSGTNQFHGSAYEFHQNVALNARDFFNNVDANGNPGPGPITPFVQNQAGFTVGGPVFKDHTFFFGHWEIDKTRGGGSTSVASVLTPTQVAGITDPAALALFQADGAPQSTSGTVSNSAPNQDNGHSWSARVDQNLHGGRDSFFVRYGENPDTAVSPGLTFVSSNLPGFGAQVSSTSRNVAIGYTMSPTASIVNQFRFGFGRSNPNFVANSPFPLGPQVIFLSGEVDSFGESNIIPQGRTQNTFQYGDTLSWVKGRHTWKFGTDFVRYQSPSVFDSNVRGTLRFADVASFQAGDLTGGSFTQNVGNSVRHNFALDAFMFAQDDFRITDTLTMNLGFRLESAGGVSEENGLLSNLDPNNTTPIGVLGTGPLGGIDNGGTAFNRNWNPAPRVGFAWNPGRGKLVLRGGYGIAYDYIFLNPITNLRFSAPFLPSITVQQFGGNNTLANFIAGTSDAQQQVAAAAAAGQFLPTQVNFGSISPVAQNLQNPRNQQFDVGLEYQAMKALTLKASWIGSKNDHLQVSVPLNLTDPSLRPAAATSLADEQARASQFAAFVKGESGSAVSGNNRIDPRFNSVNQVQSIGTSSYNSLQLEALGKFGQWLSFNANYTWGHSIDDVSDVLGVLVNDSAAIATPNQPLAFNRSNSQFDLRQRMNLSYTYQIPFARNLSNGFAKRVLDGWSTSGIFSTQSGFPATILAGSIVIPAGATNPKTSISDGQLLGNGVVWANGDATQIHPVPNGFQVTGISGLSQPLVGQQGTSGRNHLRLDGLTDLDAALTKAFKVTEKTNFQLRWEVFNALNHPNLSGFVNTFTSPVFGTYQSTATNMRQMQISARVQF